MQELKTACGGVIEIPCKVEEHLVAHPGVRNLLPEAVGRLALPTDGSFLSMEVEMERIVGRSGCVQVPQVSPSSCTLFAQRVGRSKPSRVFVGEGEETTKVVILAFSSRKRTNTYVLVSSWIGPLAPREPWDLKIQSQTERQECLRFWCTHALVWDQTVMSESFKSSWSDILS